MATLARYNTNHRHYRCARKKRKMKQKNQLPVAHNSQKTGTITALLTLLCLIGILIILVYFRPS